jgi:predicted AAA+ superfamily ATPase
MKERSLWLDKINQAWRKRSIVWLSGVRRVGKTTLAQMLPDAHYINCDLPSSRRRLADPEAFFESAPQGSPIIFDEVHRVDDPSQLLKIASDEYPTLRILATGSSTLAATQKFRDSLTGRKAAIYLSPVLWEECQDSFGVIDLDRRLLHGGLPEPLLAQRKDPDFFSEWLDSFYARDIQELFGIRHRSGFLKLLEHILRQSGSQLRYTRLAKHSGLSRPTVTSHVEAMRIAHALYLLPPYSGGGRREITRMPKCYAFDTGFVTHARGWEQIREEDRGILWEHLVLDHLRSKVPAGNLFYWRDKSRREIDFVVKRGREALDCIECKINPDRFQPSSLLAFRERYPRGDNFVVSPRVKTPYRRAHGELAIRFCSGFPRRDGSTLVDEGGSS